MMAVGYKVVRVRDVGILGKICRLASCGGQLKNSPFYADVAQLIWGRLIYEIHTQLKNCYTYIHNKCISADIIFWVSNILFY